MSPAEWQQVKAVFERARHVRPAERDVLLASESLEPGLRREVESLLAVYDESPEYLEGASPKLPDEHHAGALAGRVVGHWRLMREIGRGGMGVVWEAERADEEYKQRVAVKLLPGSSFSRSGITRFREERRILALLEHRSIARLLDGGSLDDGTPYLVMEYVEGQPLDTWCEGHNPSLRARLELFLQICGAVEYAHRRLVVHRDLKPANVLVTGDGTPKLLDFGIAKLLDPEDGPESPSTQPSERILTPGFASPEQIRGEPASTVSDVYSLGVLLYLMLTGRRPYEEQSHNPVKALRAVLEQDPPPPSTAAGLTAGRQLRGELDAIVLRAMRKNPDERYPSVRAFTEDIRAWLEGRPVEAHPDPAWRRAMKVVRRNRVPSLAAALVLLTVIGGAAISLWQAQAARRERNRAESSFRQVRQFSRSVLFELNDAIRNLPGSTPARELLIRRATELLDNLARNAGEDTALKLELVEGYRRLGQVQGSAFSDNLGREDDALGSLRKAVRLAEEAYSTSRTDPNAAGVLLGAYTDLSAGLMWNGDRSQADAVDKRLREVVARLEDTPGIGEGARLTIAASYSSLGFNRVQRGDLAAAKQDFRRAADRFENLTGRGVKLPELNDQYVVTLKRLGAVLIKEGSLAEAEQYYRRALKIEDADLTARPGDKRLSLDRTSTLSDLALILRRKNDLSGAARVYEEVVSIRRAALASDPENRRFLDLTVSSELNLAGIYSREKRHEEALNLSRTALRRREGSRTSTFQNEGNVAAARVSLAFFSAAAAEDVPPPRRRAFIAEAEDALRRAAPFVEHLTAENLSVSYRALQADFLYVRGRLQKLSESPSPAR